MVELDYQEIVDRRRALKLEPYKSLAAVGFDGPWVTHTKSLRDHSKGPSLLRCIGSMSLQSSRNGRPCKALDIFRASGSTL